MNTISTSSVFRICLFLGLMLLCLQPGAQIQFQGLLNENEGSASWDANGSGPEPIGTGHLGTAYYVATRDYVDAGCSYGAHATSVTSGFAGFTQALSANGFTIGQLKFRAGLASQGAQVQNVDWFLFPLNEHYINFGPMAVTFYLNGEPLISGEARYMIFHFGNSTNNEIQCISNYFKPVDASMGSTAAVQAVAAALLQDIGSQELKWTMQSTGTTWPLSGNGRTGSLRNFYGSLEIGLPKLPFQGLAVDHEGFAGWDATGHGPEPKADGHGGQLYYIASRDYDEIDPHPDAGFAHFLSNGWQGFQHMQLQMRKHSFSASQLKVKMGLRDLGRDIEGEDWSNINNISTVNFYHSLIMVTLDGENLFGWVCDTAITSINYNNPSGGWYGTTAYTLCFDASASSSADVRAVAAAFFRDLEDRQLHTETYKATDVSGVISTNGRTGGFWQIDSAALVFSAGPGTIVPAGNVSGQWTKAGHPYIVTGDISIPNGQSLTIQPGVWVKFTGPINIDVQGTLVAHGNATHQGGIVFTAVNPEEGWGHLVFDNTPGTNAPSVFKYCTFEYGAARDSYPIKGTYTAGGAISINNFDDVVIEHCLFQHNWGLSSGQSYGGAIQLISSSPKISNSMFMENTGSVAGGAITCYGSASPEIVNCLFYKNKSLSGNWSGGGAILACEKSGPRLTNNAFIRNHSEWQGGGIEIRDSSSARMINNIFWGNTATVGSQVSISNAGCSADLKYNDIQGGLSGIGPYGTGGGVVENNIDLYPFFSDTLALNYRLRNSSPCKDSGIPDLSGIYMPPDDLLGNVRVWNGGSGSTRIDMGPYEFLAPLYTGLNENKPMANPIGLSAWPNPFSDDLTLQFTLKQPGAVVIVLYNELGQVVSIPVRDSYQPGIHTVTLSSESLKPGFYCLRLDNGNVSGTVKVLKSSGQ